MSTDVLLLHGLAVEARQSNHEGELISDRNARVPWRHTGVVAPVAAGSL